MHRALFSEIKSPKKSVKPEQSIHKAYCRWLKMQHPNVYFDSDPSGLRVSMGIRNLLKATRSNHAHLDIFIAESRGSFHGFFLELKFKDPFKKDGSLKSDKKKDKKSGNVIDHNEEQQKAIDDLTSRGYLCHRAWELQKAIKITEEYLALE